MLPGIWMSVNSSEDVVARLEDRRCASSALTALDRHEARVLDDVDRAHPQDHFVLDDEDDGWSRWLCVIVGFLRKALSAARREASDRRCAASGVSSKQGLSLPRNHAVALATSGGMAHNRAFTLECAEDFDS